MRRDTYNCILAGLLEAVLVQPDQDVFYIWKAKSKIQDGCRLGNFGFRKYVRKLHHCKQKTIAVTDKSIARSISQVHIKNNIRWQMG